MLSIDLWSPERGRWERGPTLVPGKSYCVPDNRIDGRYEIVITANEDDTTVTEARCPLDGAPGAPAIVQQLVKGGNVEIEWRGDLRPDVVRILRLRQDMIVAAPES